MPHTSPRAKAGVLFRGVASHVLLDKSVSREALRVLGVLLGHMEWKDRIHVRVRDIAGELGIAPPNATRGLTCLRKAGIVTRVRPGEYALNPQLVRVGPVTEARTCQQTLAEADIRRAQEDRI